jgi:hypothetical protein
MELFTIIKVGSIVGIGKTIRCMEGVLYIMQMDVLLIKVIGVRMLSTDREFCTTKTRKNFSNY